MCKGGGKMRKQLIVDYECGEEMLGNVNKSGGVQQRNVVKEMWLK